MALDATVSESRLRDSIRKFFVDNIITAQGITVGFDRTVSPPDENTDKWVNVLFDNIAIYHVADAVLNVYMFTLNDLEGDELSALRDTVFEALFDPGAIDIYDASWNKVGSMLVSINEESGIEEAPDGTKMKSLIATLRWGAVS